MKRLPGQLIGYGKVLDFLHVITETKHVNHIQELVPNWVGVSICQLNGEVVNFIDVQEAKKNPNKEAFHIAKLLWREEIIDILMQYDIRFRKKDRNWLLCEALATNLELEPISEIVRNKLKLRQGWKLIKQ